MGCGIEEDSKEWGYCEDADDSSNQNLEKILSHAHVVSGAGVEGLWR